MSPALTHVIDFLQAHPNLAVLFAFLTAFGEAMLILGLFVPSTMLLVGLGTLIGLGKMAFLPVFIATVAGAIVGDAVSFWAGVHWKDRIRTFWPFYRYEALMHRGEDFIAKHGGKSIFIVRFIPAVKAVVPTLAGMMGMSPRYFAFVNVISAFVWAAVHLLPAVALGRGLQVAHAANPRFVILIVLGVFAAVIAWATERFARAVLFPAADRGRLSLARWLEGKGPRAAPVVRFLRNEDSALETTALAVLAVLALSGFMMVLVTVTFDPQLSLADAAIGRFVQGLRTDWFTSGMVAVTMLGDLAVVLPVLILLALMLAAFRQWSLSGAVICAALTASAVVPFLKAVLHRTRPILVQQGKDVFSFPSGHTATSSVVFGILALFLAQAAPVRFRGLIYAVFSILIALVAFSRIYLQAHWPSDVVAGLLLGLSVVFVMAVILNRREIPVPGWAYAAVMAAIGFGVVPFHLWTGHSAAEARYDVPPPVTTLALGEWLDGGWQAVPARRILLDGDPGEAMSLQTDLARDQVVTALKGAGWVDLHDTLSGDLLSALIPSRRALADRAPWPMTHLGRPPLISLGKLDPELPDQRLVLRIWDSGFQVVDAIGPAPLLLVSLTADVLDPIAFGWMQLEQAGIAPDRLAAQRGAIAQVLPQPARPASDAPTAPLLVPR